jgi:hypothetical protein
MDETVMPAIKRLGAALEEAGSVADRVMRIFNEAEESTRAGIEVG